MNTLRAYIRLLLEEEILGEPDMSSEDEREEGDYTDRKPDEQNVTGNIAGYTLPLGMGSKDVRDKKRKGAVKANASAFGGAKGAQK